MTFLYLFFLASSSLLAAIDSTPPIHGPVATVCNELIDYYQLFSKNLLNNARTEEKGGIDLLCSALTLTATMTDQDFRHVRAEEIIISLGGVVEALSEIPRVTRSSSPNLGSLLHLYRSKDPDSIDEANIKLQQILRSPETGSPLVHEIFKLGRNYTQDEVLYVVDELHGHSAELLRNFGPPMTRNPGKENHPKNARSREFKQRAFAYQTAADACEELADALTPSMASYKHAHELISLSQSFFSAISLTYNHLGKSHPRISGNELSEFSNRFAEIITVLTEIAPSGAPLESAYLERCAHLPSKQARENFISEVFHNSLDREALFEEFFPTLSRCFHRQVSDITQSFEEYTISALEKSYWINEPH